MFRLPPMHNVCTSWAIFIEFSPCVACNVYHVYPLKVVKWTSPLPIIQWNINFYYSWGGVSPHSPPLAFDKRVTLKSMKFYRSVTGISISHRRHVVRYTGGKTKMGVQNVRRRRQRSHWYSRDDENRSGIIHQLLTSIRIYCLISHAKTNTSRPRQPLHSS